MPTSLLNLKRCSILSSTLPWLLSLAVTTAWANAPLPCPAQPLRNDLSHQKAGSFNLLISQWEVKYGTNAVSPLFQIASDKKIEDTNRYIALMGAAKIGGTETAPQVSIYLRDSSWMIRSAALRALKALRNPKTAHSVLALLNDKALVVRSEAIDTIAVLKPAGSTEALMKALDDRGNYHGGKAQGVPQKALQALALMKAREITRRLRPLLHHDTDTPLRLQALATIESLSGKVLVPGGRIAEKVAAWDQALKFP